MLQTTLDSYGCAPAEMIRAKRQKNGSKVTTLRLASPPASPPSFRRHKLSQVCLARSLFVEAFCACPFCRGTCCRCGAFRCRQPRCRRYREASHHMSPGNRGHHGLLAKRPAPGTVHLPHKACCAPTLEVLHQHVQYAAVLYCIVLYPYWCLVGEG